MTAHGLASPLPPLDRECETCEGTGFAYGQRRTCATCKGEGYPLTDAGREVIAFLRRHNADLTHVTFHSTHDHDEYGRVTRP